MEQDSPSSQGRSEKMYSERFEPEVIYVQQHRISCDGGGGALGHPIVWYTLKDGVAECGYCGRRFIYKEI